MNNAVGVGTDLVDIDRFRAVIARTPGLIERLFTLGERDYAFARRDPAERLAVRFAAKEAVLKALGLGIGAMRFADIEVVRAESGRPAVALVGSAAEVARNHGVAGWLISLSHTDAVAHAVVIALGRPSGS